MNERAEKYERIFQELQNYVGKQVTCIYWEYGNRSGYQGILSEIVPFDFINIDGKIINFVGDINAVECIFPGNTPGVAPIYQNELVKGYYGSVKDIMQVIEAQRSCLGYSVLEENMLKRHGAK